MNVPDAWAAPARLAAHPVTPAERQPPAAAVDVSVIVVGLNARQFVEQCWATVKASGWLGLTYEMIYVDNGSSDDTLVRMQDIHPDVDVIANAGNAGFCRAANQGAKRARGRHLCFLNDDVLVLDDAIALAVSYLDAHPGIGVLGARLLNVDRTDQWSGRRFPTLLNGLFARRSPLMRLMPDARPLRRYLYRDEIARGSPFDADWVSAAGLIVRRPVFDAVGCYDESYYYWHEAVFCHRVAAAGWRVVLHPDVRIVHYEGYGSGKRSFAARRWHVRDFHGGAYRAQVEQLEAEAGPARRALIWTLLEGRKHVMLARIAIAEAVDRLRPPAPKT